MISSYEVAQMQAQQAQMMMQSQQMGLSSTMPYGYPMAGHNLPNSGFSYAGSGDLGYGMGNAAGQGVVNSAQSAFKGVGYAAAGIGAGIGYKAGGAMGALRGGLMAGGPLLGAGLMAGGHVFGNMAEGGQELSATQQTLGANFQFSNGLSKTGRGFSRTDAKGISDMVREMQALPELLTSFGELNNIMGKISQLGTMNGVRNAQEFGRKFKETITTLKDISKIMETSMEGAVKYFEEARRSGMYSPQMMKMNMGQRQFTAGVTGMNQEQVGQLQQMGSQISFGYGGLRGSGAQSALRSARQIGMANEMGIMSNDRIAELTGMDGAAGIQSMAGTLTETAQRMSGGSFGTAMSAALGKQDKSGRFTGAMDQELVDKVRMGGISKSELLSLANRKTSSRLSKMSFKDNQNMLRSEMASQVGAEGIGMEMQDILGGAGFKDPEATGILMQKYGVDERQAKIIQEIGNNLPSIQKELGSKAQTEGRRQAEQSYTKENLSTEAIKKKFMKRMENTFSEPFKQLGANMSNSVGQYVDDFMDGLLGRYSTNITKETANLAGGALGGGGSSQRKLGGMLDSVGGTINSSQLQRTSVTGSESAISMLTGEKSFSAKKYSMLEGLMGKKMAYDGGDGMTQDSSEIARTKQYFSNLQEGKMDSGVQSKVFGSNETFGMMDNMKNKVSDIIKEHGAEMKDMSQADRIDFIKNKINSKWFGSGRSDLISLNKSGISTEDIIGYAQQHGKVKDNLGAVNFNKLSSEMYGSGDFGAAKELSAKVKETGSKLAESFKDKSGVETLLGGDSKTKDLFLKASSGDTEAHELLTKELPLEQKEKLLSKYGITESQLDSVQKLYGGGNKDSELAKSFMRSSNRASLGGLAAQYRRQGNDMGGRLERSGLQGPAKDVIAGLASSLSGLTDADKLKSFLTGKGSDQIDFALSSVSGLKGKDREAAMAALGEGASSAIGFGDYVKRTAGRKGGLSSLKGKIPEELLQEFEGRAKNGGLSAGDADELGRKARNASYGGSLSASGSVAAKDVASQKEYMENLNRFAQTTAQFAQLVISATPQLDATVKKAQEKLTEDANIKPPN